LLLTICINAAWAVRISGTVITGDDNEPAIGAAVRAYASSDNTKLLAGDFTDQNGKFDFDVPDPNALVVIHLLGQADQNFKPSELNGRTIILQPDPIMLQEVVVTAKRPTQSSRGGDGCDDESNDRITPELALCSVHAYNIGEETNPDGTNRQLMKDVVALKTTVITQQMNKQYEYMEAMIRRFKTQLEKAVLTTKLQAAGATSASSDADSGGAGGTYGTKSSGVGTNRGLATAEDCINTYSTYEDIYQCLLRNVAKIQSAVAAGDLGTARHQLATDRTTLASFNNMPILCAENQPNCTVNVPCESALGDNKNCAKAIKNGSRREDITTCLGQMRACIIANSDAQQRKNNNNRQ